MDDSPDKTPEPPNTSFSEQTSEQLTSAVSAERQSFLKLTRELASLPLDKSAAALETSAAIAAISLRAGIEFLRAAPAAAEVLEPAELRSWGELGRRLALADVENAITFFAEGVSELNDVPAAVHSLVFQLCSRQITLSSQVRKYLTSVWMNTLPPANSASSSGRRSSAALPQPNIWTCV